MKKRERNLSSVVVDQETNRESNVKRNIDFFYAETHTFKTQLTINRIEICYKYIQTINSITRCIKASIQIYSDSIM